MASSFYPPGLQAGQALVVWTDILDFTQTQTVFYTNMPAMPGFIAIPTSSRIVTISKAGTISTSFTMKAGNDASNVNWHPSQTPATNLFTTSAAPVMGNTLTGASAPFAAVDLATRPSVVITVGAVGTDGTFAWRGRIAAVLIVFPIV